MKKNIVKGIVFLSLTAAMFLVAEAGNARNAEVKPIKLAKIDAEGDSVLGIMRVRPGATVKFSADSMIMSDGETTEKFKLEVLKRIDYISECNSPFTVRVTADDEDLTPLEGIAVVVAGEDLAEYDAVVKTSNSEGEVVFNELPFGNYKMYMVDPDGWFLPAKELQAKHVYDDAFSYALSEKVWSPCYLRHSFEETDNGRFRVFLNWLIGPEESYGPFRDYQYYLSLNGEDLGETTETNYCIEDLEQGFYTVELYGRTPYGNITEPLSLDFELSSLSGLESIRGEEEGEARYYDLTGKPVDKSRLSPGIYIRTYKGKSEKYLVRDFSF